MKRNILFALSISLVGCGAINENTQEENYSSETKNTDNKIENSKNIEMTGYSVGFYNVENLFDTKDDPNTSDDWFTPEGEAQWDQTRYLKKLKDLSKVISSLNENGPSLLGLCEVENKEVVNDLIKEPLLMNTNYKIVHYDSPDTRGIDVAAIYDSELFDLISSESIEVEMPEDPAIKTRDILYCQLQSKLNNEVLHFYVNHWSSRRKGEQETFFKRKNCVTTLVNHMKEMQLDRENDNIVIVGDMNDYPDDKSIYEILEAKEANAGTSLVNIQYDNHSEGKGTYNHQGDWGVLDNIIVSRVVYNNLKEKDADIFDEDWVMYFNKNGDAMPNKTYGGPKYYGGYSDHLAVCFTLVM